MFDAGETFKKMKQTVGIEPAEAEDSYNFCDLSFQTRMIGFFVCVGLGTLFSFLSSFLFLNPTKFATAYTLGNICFLGSTVFLVGPKKQMKSMFTNNRWIASLLYIGSMIITIVVAFSPSFTGQSLVMLLFIIIQALAITWYTLSFIPYARTVVTAMVSAMCSRGSG